MIKLLRKLFKKNKLNSTAITGNWFLEYDLRKYKTLDSRLGVQAAMLYMRVTNKGESTNMLGERVKFEYCEMNDGSEAIITSIYDLDDKLLSIEEMCENKNWHRKWTYQYNNDGEKIRETEWEMGIDQSIWRKCGVWPRAARYTDEYYELYPLRAEILDD